jgi:hypothetical protein
MEEEPGSGECTERGKGDREGKVIGRIGYHQPEGRMKL